MSTSKFRLIIVLMVTTLSGILLAQYLWVQRAYELNEQSYKSKINEALNSIVKDLKSDDISLRMENLFDFRPSFSDSLSYTSHVTVVDTFLNEELLIEDSIGSYEIQVISEYSDLNGSRDAVYAQYTTDKDTIIKTENWDSKGHQFTLNEESGFGEDVEIIIAKVIGDLRGDENLVESRLEGVALDSVIKTNLENLGIPQDFEYAISDEKDKNLIQKYSSKNYTNKLGFSFSKGLFNENSDTLKNKLFLTVLNPSSYIFGEIKNVLILCLLLTGLMILTFFMTLRTLWKQKKLTELKNDFINNLTHELKTPIATISLALDAMNHQEAGPNEMENFSQIIRQENQRLKGQVEKVLELAHLEKVDSGFEMEDVSLKKVILESVEQFDLHLNKLDGDLTLNLSERDLLIKGDLDHLKKMMVNLLDNSIKYSQSKPKIQIDLLETEETNRLIISDQGIGMSSESLHRIFENFYRETKGDLHQTKGFGLGMSYVKLIVDKHGAQILVKSKKNEGTSVVIDFQKI